MCPDLRLRQDSEQKLESDPISDAGNIAEIAKDGVITRGHADRHHAGANAGRADGMSRIADKNELAGSGVDSLSDAELARSALAAINRSALLTPGKVRPLVRNGWLILHGEVEGVSQKRAAEDAVRGLNGIRGMSNNILIENEVIAQRVNQKIDETFTRSARLNAHRISVTARNHRVILAGSVRSGAEREEAETAAWTVPGVAEVVNRIRTD